MNITSHILDSKELILAHFVEKINELADVSLEIDTAHSSIMLQGTVLGTGREGRHEKSDSGEDSHDLIR